MSRVMRLVETVDIPPRDHWDPAGWTKVFPGLVDVDACIRSSRSTAFPFHPHPHQE